MVHKNDQSEDSDSKSADNEKEMQNNDKSTKGASFHGQNSSKDAKYCCCLLLFCMIAYCEYSSFKYFA